jgi:chromosomal replication initiator protein
MVFAGTRSPAELEGIEPRLTSRFEWGLLLPLHVLSPLELQEWFVARCAHKKITLSQDTSTFLTERLPTPSLLSSLLELLTEGTVSLDEAKKQSDGLAEVWKKKQITPEKIIAATAEAFEIHSSDILGRGQSQELSLSRQIAIYLCRKNLALSYVKIAHIFTRDHSTVMASIKAIEKKMEEPGSATASHLQTIKSKLS